MADYTDSSVDDRSQDPDGAIDAHEWSRIEPLLTPALFYKRFLWGIPLISNVMNPFTHQYDRLEEEDLKDIIMRSISMLEAESGIDIFPVKRREKVPFDRNEMIASGTMRANHRPIISVDKLSIAPGNSPDILTIAPEWISTGSFQKGLVHIIPTINSVVSGGYIPASGAVGQGSAFVAIMGGQAWTEAFWTLEYTTGVSADGRMPRALNELIGVYAAIEVLGLLATTNRTQSQSISMDGISQSVSTGGINMYKERIENLEAKKEKLLKKFRAKYGNKFAISTI